MAALISEFTVNGEQLAEAMFANKPAWHGLGTVFNRDGSQAPDSATALELAHLNWPVSRDKLFLADQPEAIPNTFATTRISPETGKPLVLGIVGKQYRVQQNVECFEFLDSLCQDGILRYESAFALRGGQKVVMVARMPSVDTIAEGDDLLRYVMMTNTHDGSGAITLTPTSVRPVCANTVQMAMQKNGSLSVSVRHTQNKDERLNDAREYISQFDEAFTLFRDKARKLASIGIKTGEGAEYLRTLFPEPDHAEKAAYANWTAKVDRMAELYKRGPNNNLPAIRGTWWSLFNAVTEYIDHESKFRGDNAKDNRFESLISGPLANTKVSAFRVAMSMASVA